MPYATIILLTFARTGNKAPDQNPITPVTKSPPIIHFKLLDFDSLPLDTALDVFEDVFELIYIVIRKLNKKRNPTMYLSITLMETCIPSTELINCPMTVLSTRPGQPSLCYQRSSSVWTGKLLENDIIAAAEFIQT